jgi:phage tail sheath gpL-like
MSIDASAIARVIGIATTFVNLRGGVAFLPQRIAVLAQGSTAVTYPTTKQQITSSAQAGNLYGWGSPIHKIARQLFPDNNDGVGTIPVTVYPLVDDGSGAAATADITPSGTTTAAASYYVRVSGTLSAPFTIPSGAAVVNDRCRAIGKAVAAILNMPVLSTYAYGAVTSAAGGSNVGNGTCTVLSVTGTPVPGAWSLVVNTAVANGGVWTLTDPDGNVISTSVTMTPGVGGATVINVGGIQFTLTDASTDFAVGDKFTITVPATKVNLTAKWKGVTGNDLVVEVLQPSPSVGAVFTITAPHGGLVNPSISTALTLMGNVWETMVINQMGTEDTTTLDLLSTFGEGRWGQLVRKPLIAFCGNTKSSVSTATAVSSTRLTDRTNCELVAPGSVALPFVVAARQVARIAVMANNNPPTDYGSLPVDGILPGDDSVQWDYPTRDLAVKAGCSTVEVNDGVMQIGDVVTMYHPTGDPNPAYRYVVDIVKLQNIIFNTNLIFAAPEWAAAPLIPDDQPTVNPNARKPRSAKTEVAVMIDSLGLNAIISDPKTAKKSIQASINAQNPKRLDLQFTVQLAGNSNVKSVDLLFGFFYGSPALAA